LGSMAMIAAKMMTMKIVFSETPSIYVIPFGKVIN